MLVRMMDVLKTNRITTLFTSLSGNGMEKDAPKK